MVAEPGKKQVKEPKSAATRKLESIVFGGGASEDEEPEDQAPAEEEEEAADDAAPTDAQGKKSLKRKGKKAKAETADAAQPRSAWVDEDDVNMTVDLDSKISRKRMKRTEGETKIKGEEYERRLREGFRKAHGVVDWAEQQSATILGRGDAAYMSSDEEEEEMPVPTSAKGVLAKVGGRLRPTELSIEKMRELDHVPAGPSKKGPAVIQAMQFHPDSELMLTGGMDKTLRLFAVDGEENPKVSSHFFKDFNIMGAKFLPHGDQVVMCCLDHRVLGLDIKTGKSFRIRAFEAQHYTNLIGPFVSPTRRSAGGTTGMRTPQELYAVLTNTGAAVLCDTRTKMPVRTLRMNGPGVGVAFAEDREIAWTADQEANIYEWDLGSGRCKQRVKDDFSSRFTSMSVSRPSANAPSSILAAGTPSGNVDFFDLSGPKLSGKPLNSMDNITTSITGCAFHGSGEVMAAYSKYEVSALKMVHVATNTVFANWPSLKAPLNKVTVCDFSHRNGYFATGNEKGRVLLWRLMHYQS